MPTNPGSKKSKETIENTKESDDAINLVPYVAASPPRMDQIQPRGADLPRLIKNAVTSPLLHHCPSNNLSSASSNCPVPQTLAPRSVLLLQDLFTSHLILITSFCSRSLPQPQGPRDLYMHTLDYCFQLPESQHHNLQATRHSCFATLCCC